MTSKHSPTPEPEEPTRTFQSVEDYLLHYSAKKDDGSQKTEWYELGAEATRIAIKHAEHVKK
ncbi:MAG: hypothetical protein FWE88_01785 [Phycisphaerae bacterium]|nr:hypothetical protein [Phycisphaerae bacterium]